jgi:predicted nucleic acid-binding Zn ribbon protein
MTYGYVEIPEDYWVCSDNVEYILNENDME